MQCVLSTPFSIEGNLRIEMALYDDRAARNPLYSAVTVPYHREGLEEFILWVGIMYNVEFAFNDSRFDECPVYEMYPIA